MEEIYHDLFLFFSKTRIFYLLTFLPVPHDFELRTVFELNNKYRHESQCLINQTLFVDPFISCKKKLI